MNVLLNSLLNQRVGIKTYAGEGIIGTLDYFTEEFIKLTTVEFTDGGITTKPSSAYIPMPMIRLIYPIVGNFMMLME